MNFDQSAPSFVQPTDLLFPDQVNALRQTLAGYDQVAMAKLMKISPKLAGHVVDLYTSPSGQPKPAIYAYRGDVYRGLGVDRFNQADMEWANQHILIPSGLYGLVRPFDQIEQYRLEMKLKLGDQSLYDFWGDQLARYVRRRDDTVLVIASKEYAQAVVSKLPSDTRIVEVIFQDRAKSGQMKIVPIYSKIMRGVMAGYIIKHRIDDPSGLHDFSEHGYSYSAADSSPDQLVFQRAEPAVIAV